MGCAFSHLVIAECLLNTELILPREELALACCFMMLLHLDGCFLVYCFLLAA